MLWLTAVASAGVLRHALIIGANEGGGSLDALHYAEQDAQRMAEVLVELGGFDPAYVTVLYSPSVAELNQAMTEHAIFAGSFDEDLFLLYYSGHADARGLRLGSELYTFESLKSGVRAIPAEVKLGILDACRSGAITRLKGASVSAPFLEEQELAAEGEAWMTATSADESAQESDQLRGSFFTHYLVSGLRGAADDGGDGSISLDEAYRYAFDRVVDHTGETSAGSQHPNFDYRLKGQGDLTLTQVGSGHATLVIPAELAGDLLILKLPDRSPVAEVAKVAGRPVSLALPPGTYKLRLTQGKSIQEATVGLNDGARVTASSWGGVTATTGNSKGGPVVGGGVVVQDARELAMVGAQEGKRWFSAALNAPDYRHSPLIAGLASAGLPGAGQFYNGNWGRGALYMTGFSLFMGSSLIANEGRIQVGGSLTGPDVLRLTAMMLYGASVADAAWSTRRGEIYRPRKGVTLSTAVDWAIGQPWNQPAVAGVTLEVPLVRGLSLSVDRLGWTRTMDQGAVVGQFGIGSRMDLYIDGEKLRPGFFGAVGLRVTTDPSLPEVSPVIGAGVNFRWYVTPRYFVQWEGRAESAGGPVQVQLGGGLGVHFGGSK
jgi:Caspase domain